jgi:hypothetical protein
MTISQTVILEMLISGLKVFCDASCPVAAMLRSSSNFWCSQPPFFFFNWNLHMVRFVLIIKHLLQAFLVFDTCASSSGLLIKSRIHWSFVDHPPQGLECSSSKSSHSVDTIAHTLSEKLDAGSDQGSTEILPWMPALATGFACVPSGNMSHHN